MRFLQSVFVVKLVHTLIFVFMSACITLVCHAAATGHVTGLTWAAFACVLLEAVVFVGNGWRCPLTDYAESLGAGNGSVADIFLPAALAKYLPVVASTVFGSAALVLIARTLTH